MEYKLEEHTDFLSSKKSYRNILFGMSLICASAPVLAGWDVQWIDTFEGDSVDWNNWTAQTNANYNAEEQCYTDDDSSANKNYDVSDGTLKIIARKQSIACPGLGNTQKAWTSGRLNSKDKAEFLYGRIESRIRFQHNAELLAGTWPAFWVLENRINQQPIAYDGDDVNWPNAGASEIDIWEWFNNSTWYPSGAPDFYITNFFNEVSYDSSSKTECGSNVSYNYPNGSADVQDWHNYAMEWTEDNISFYIDDTLVVSQDVSNCNQYENPMFALLNVAMGGNLGGPINANLTTVTMEVDYVAHCLPSDSNGATYCNEELVEVDNGLLNVSINVMQNGQNITEINPENGLVTISAKSSNTIEDSSYSYDWNTDRLPNAVTTGNQVSFDPSSMEDGYYYVSVTITDDQDPDLKDDDSMILKVGAGSVEPSNPTNTDDSNSSSGGSVNQLLLVCLTLLFIFRRRFKSL